MIKIIILAAGGAVGTLLRYALSGVTYRFMGGIFPWGTLAVNLTGSLAIGFLFFGWLLLKCPRNNSVKN